MGYEHWRYARRVDADSFQLFTPSYFKIAALSKSGADDTLLVGQTATGKHLTLKANSTNTYAWLKLHGNGKVEIAGGLAIELVDSGLTFMKFSEDGTDDIVEGMAGDNDLYLKPAGTGVVKFGTKTGTGDVAVDGYVSIKDAAGAAVKLATVA